MKTEREFSTFDIEKILGIKRNRLNPWLRGGYIRLPKDKRATRKGTKNAFTVEDLYRVELFNQLLSAGLNSGEAAEFKEMSFENVGSGPRQYEYCTYIRGVLESGAETGSHILHKNSSPPEIMLKENELYAIVINVLNIKKKVDKAIEKLSE